MHKIFSTLFCLLLYTQIKPVYAQVADDFSDGSLSANPVWLGDDSLFKINASLQLQLNGSIGNEAAISSQLVLHNPMEWRAWFRMAYNPSSQNMARFYLSSNKSNLKMADTTLYVQLGGSTGNTDSICLYKQINNQRICLIKGRAGTLGKSNNLFSIKIIRQANGIYNLYSDTAAGTTFILEGSCTDSIAFTGAYAGFYIKYTSGNSQNFYADDFYAGPPLIDESKPQLLALECKDEQTLLLRFNEVVQKPDPTQVQINNNIYPTQILASGSQWQLSFQNPFPQDTLLFLQLKQVADVNGNLSDTSLYFYYHPLRKHEILISELMADPEPSHGLPAIEYLELYNNSPNTIQLSNCKLKDPLSTGVFPNYLLKAHSFLIVCQSKDSQSMAAFGPVCALGTFPSLNNSADSISFCNSSGEIISNVNYSMSWYKNVNMEQGGYSLEMLNPTQICKGEQNWQGSTNPLGGTPGKENAQWSTLKDSLAPQLLSAQFIGNDTLILNFSEAISKASINKQNIHITDHTLAAAWPNTSNPGQLWVTLQDSLQHLDSLHIYTDGLADCAGNVSRQELHLRFYLQKPARIFDLLIHEFYFDLNRYGNFPHTEFIELYNTSAYAISLKDFQLSDASTRVRLPDVQMLPAQYLLLCKKEYEPEFANIAPTAGLSSFPSLSLSDTLSLRDASGYLIHQVIYQSDKFYASAKTYSCSYEMIDRENPCGASENWKACQHPDGASPGKENSAEGILRDISKPNLWRLYIPNAQTLNLHFSEAIDSTLIKGISLLPYSPIAGLHYLQGTQNQIQLHLQNPLDTLLDYKIQIQSLSDCAGNTQSEIQSQIFQVPQEPLPGQIAFNEILFNPNTGREDYVELQNLSAQTLNLGKLHLLAMNENAERLADEAFAQSGIMLLPHEFILISPEKNPEALPYLNLNQAACISHKLPSMPDDQGILVLKNEKDQSIDSMAYSEKMHNPFVQNAEGVSLEKINPYLPSALASNWSSASESVYYGTPTQQNSIYRVGETTGSFSCEPPYFWIDKEGQNSLLTFSYQMAESKAVANLLIYDLMGNEVKQICHACLLGTAGELHWAGDRNEGTAAAAGNYIALWQVFVEGKKTEEKKVCVSLLRGN